MNILSVVVNEDYSMTKKEDIYDWCENWVNEKLSITADRMKAAQASANNEEKSSAGDKYETGRAMMHLEKEKLSNQLAETLKLKKVLHSFNPSTPTEVVDLGALVNTSMGKFYVAISAGKIAINDESVFGISLGSPIGQALKGKHTGDEVVFNGKVITIESVG